MHRSCAGVFTPQGMPSFFYYFKAHIFALIAGVLIIFAKFVKSRYILLLILIKQSDRISVIFYREVR